VSLKPREAKLRAEALTELDRAGKIIDGNMNACDAFMATLYGRPRVALLRIKTAKAHIAKAEAAIKKWAGR